ncbi:MAG: hypothetical protein HND55_01510 [Pseudomonadota bacterium]|nr:MAG: hypothetical protein HND55_01510 [Pseudomonadota bacterium]
MLDNIDTLLSMAEVTAVFAGFAALVTVVRAGYGKPADIVHDLLRLRLVIASSIAGVAGALIPIGIAGYGLDSDIVWRMSAVIFLIMDNGIIASFIRSYRPVRGSFPPDRLAVFLVTLLELVEQISLVAVVLGVTFVSGSALYVTALIANLCQAGFIFVRFVGSALRREQRRLSNK